VGSAVTLGTPGNEPSTRRVTIPGRGTTTVLECAGPPGAPTVILLHGVSMNAELGWAQVMRPLARHFRVVAPDQRGHAGGIPAGHRFSLEDCADDAVALAAALEVDRFIVVGYSMGGTVAQLIWRRHPQVVSGLVLCATGRNFVGSHVEQLLSMAMPAMMTWSALTTGFTADVLRPTVLGTIGDSRTRGWTRAQMSRTSLGSALAAMQAVSEFTSHDWINEVDVPTVVVVTTQDRLVPAKRQRRLAAAINGAVVMELHGDHGACVTAPEIFGRLLVIACRQVTTSTLGEQTSVDERADDPQDEPAHTGDLT